MKTSDSKEIANNSGRGWFCFENWSCEIFPGFYYGFISPDEFVRNAIERNREDREYYEDMEEEYPGIVMDEKYFDNLPCEFWSKYCDLVAELYTDHIACKVNEMFPGIISKMEFDHLWSPREYNFYTDRLNIRMKVRWSRLERWIQNHLDEFKKYLKDHWTTCSGFISFVPNNYYELKCSDKYREVCLEYFIYYVCTQGNVEEDVYYDIEENISVESILFDMEKKVKS